MRNFEIAYAGQAPWDSCLLPAIPSSRLPMNAGRTDVT
jgi:hypothetical protein